jgi:pyridoxamine 5'-phosphate oxidase
MFKLTNLNNSTPYNLIEKYYDLAFNKNEENIEAISISSYSSEKNEVDSRFVNLKMIDNDEFIFFSNYQSPKASQFLSNNQIAAVFFWRTINVQIRMKAKIKKLPSEVSDKYFSERSKDKNALAISSRQSQKISSYEDVIKNYNLVLDESNLEIRPDYWGGYSFTPYYFEFWEGHKSRLNKREVFEKNDDSWKHFILQP